MGELYTTNLLDKNVRCDYQTGPTELRQQANFLSAPPLMSAMLQCAAGPNHTLGSGSGTWTSGRNLIPQRLANFHACQMGIKRAAK